MFHKLDGFLIASVIDMLLFVFFFFLRRHLLQKDWLFDIFDDAALNNFMKLHLYHCHKLFMRLLPVSLFLDLFLGNYFEEVILSISHLA